MAFVRVWSGINFSGTGSVLSVGPIDLGTSPLTVNSVEVAPYYCITVFDAPNCIENYKTYFSKSVDTSSFSVISNRSLCKIVLFRITTITLKPL